MKKILSVAAFVFFAAAVTPAVAQDSTKKEGTVTKAWKGTKKGVKKAWKGTKKGASKVGNETAELATKGKGEITDKRSDEWVGPNGQAIYVDDGSKYYWVSEKGKRMFVSQDQLKKKQ